jgi:hypothetical protein
MLRFELDVGGHVFHPPSTRFFFIVHQLHLFIFCGGGGGEGVSLSCGPLSRRWVGLCFPQKPTTARSRFSPFRLPPRWRLHLSLGIDEAGEKNEKVSTTPAVVVVRNSPTQHIWLSPTAVFWGWQPLAQDVRRATPSTIG